MDVPNEPLHRRSHTVSDMRHLQDLDSISASNSISRRRKSETISNPIPPQSLFSYFYRSSIASSLYSSVESELSVFSSEEGEEDLKHTDSDNRKLEVQSKIIPAPELVSRFTTKEADKLRKDSVKLSENSGNTKNFSKVLPTAIYEMFQWQKLPGIQSDHVDKDSQIQHSQNMHNTSDNIAKPKSNQVKLNHRDLNSMAPISL